MTSRRAIAVGLFALALAGSFSGEGCRKKPAPGAAGVNARRPYTPIPPPPTRTLKPGEPTPPPNLPG
jgi:hypothetical protein